MKRSDNIRQIILYGVSLALLLLALRWLELRLILFRHAPGVYMTLVAMIFTVLGIWLAKKLTQPEHKKQKSEHTAITLSPRELEVLHLMARGLSNREIAGQLFVSPNTVKTHTSRIFEKMSVKRRTQAIALAKQLGWIQE